MVLLAVGYTPFRAVTVSAPWSRSTLTVSAVRDDPLLPSSARSTRPTTAMLDPGPETARVVIDGVLTALPVPVTCTSYSGLAVTVLVLPSTTSWVAADLDVEAVALQGVDDEQPVVVGRPCRAARLGRRQQRGGLIDGQAHLLDFAVGEAGARGQAGRPHPRDPGRRRDSGHRQANVVAVVLHAFGSLRPHTGDHSVSRIDGARRRPSTRPVRRKASARCRSAAVSRSMPPA